MVSMRLPTLLFLCFLVFIAAFTVLNWPTFTATEDLSFGLFSLKLPFGLILLGLLAITVAFFTTYLVYLQGVALLETRRHAKELRANQEKADNAEASRFTELRAFMREEIQRLVAQNGGARDGILKSIDALQRELRTKLDDSTNAVLATVGELDDRLETILPRRDGTGAP